MVDPERLEQINKQLQREGVPHHQRPLRAISILSRELGFRLDIQTDSEKEVYQWFKERIKPGASEIGSLFRSVFFYDDAFWPVNVPIVYGRIKANPMISLTDVPEAIKERLNRHAGAKYAIFWVHCMDYGLGFHDLTYGSNSSQLDSFGLELLKSADEELRSAVSLLIEYPPNPRALLTCRMATEMFMKSYIALKVGLTKKDAKSIGHDLEKAFESFCDTAGLTNHRNLKSKLSVFSEVNDRYNPQTAPPKALWEGFRVTQPLAAFIIREFTKRRVIEDVIRSLCE